MSDEQKPGDPANRAVDGAFLAWVTSHPIARLASGEGALLLAENDRLREDNTALTAAIERVLALHEIFGDWCDRCNCVAPCATLRALEGTP